MNVYVKSDIFKKASFETFLFNEPKTDAK